MLGWALAFFILALVAAYMGFYGLMGLAAVVASAARTTGNFMVFWDSGLRQSL